MTGVAVPALLAVLVALAWIVGLAVNRLPRALDRLHAVTLLALVGGPLLSAAAFAADGLSGRSLKVLLLAMLLAVSNTVLSHAIGRALLLREGPDA